MVERQRNILTSRLKEKPEQRKSKEERGGEGDSKESSGPRVIWMPYSFCSLSVAGIARQQWKVWN
jgi:hypothetical protein